MVLKIFPVQSKSFSGFFGASNIAVPYTLILSKSLLILKFLGIPFITINLRNIVSFKYVGDEWFTKIFNGVVIKYKKGTKVEERIITFPNKEKSLEFLRVLGEIVKSSMLS